MDTTPYTAYLLRLWQTTSNGERVWRASLETPRTGERQGFPDLESLLNFLVAQTREKSENKAGWNGSSNNFRSK